MFQAELIRLMSNVMYFLLIQYEFFRNFMNGQNTVIKEWSQLFTQNLITHNKNVILGSFDFHLGKSINKLYFCLVKFFSSSSPHLVAVP